MDPHVKIRDDIEEAIRFYDCTYDGPGWFHVLSDLVWIIFPVYSLERKLEILSELCEVVKREAKK